MTSAFFTITARNYLHYARALAASLAQRGDQIERVLVIVDAPSGSINSNELPEFDRVIHFDEIGLPAAVAFSFRYDVIELCTAVKPFVFSKLLDEGYDQLVYLDPDILVYRPLSEVFALLASGASSVLTPHSLAPNLHAEPPDEHTFLQADAYNLGFVAIADTRHSRDALQWWQARLEHEFVSNRVREGVFFDQKFMDLWPSYCADTIILRDPTYNVAYWNLGTRHIAATESGYLVEGLPLTFFHFSGIVPGNRKVLSKHQTRWTTASSPELSRLVDEYHVALDNGARAKWSEAPYGYATFRDGTTIPKLARVYFREELEPFSGDPFETLPQMLDLPAAVHPNPFGVVTQLMHTLWKERSDLQAHFHLRDANSQLRYGEWYATNGAIEAGIPATFAEVPRRALAAAAQQARGTRKRFGTRIARLALAAVFRIRPHIRFLYRHISVDRRRRLIDRMLGAAWRADRLPLTAQPLEPGLSLIGYPFAEMGVGENMLRISVGLEDPQDLIDDLDAALRKVGL